MLVSSFTVPELDHLRANCNFVNNEVELFEMRARGIPLEAIAEALNISVDTARKTSQKVNKKISKVMGSH